MGTYYPTVLIIPPRCMQVQPSIKALTPRTSRQVCGDESPGTARLITPSTKHPVCGEQRDELLESLITKARCDYRAAVPAVAV